MPQRKKVTPKILEQDERVKLALRLRAAGKSYQEIADHPYPTGVRGMLYGGDRHNCRRDIVAARNDAIREPAQEVIDMEVERLDLILVGLVSKGAFKGNVPAANAALNVMARRAKLLGLDTPTQIEQVGDGVINVTFTEKLAPSGGMADPELDVDLPDA
jgi:hypothetical protein